MVRIRRDTDDSGRYAVRTPRRADPTTRGHDEAPREARPPGRVPSFPPERRSGPRGPPGHRPDLRRIGCTRPERRVGDAQESARRDEASHVGPAIAHDPRRLEGLRADRRSPRRGFDEGPTAAARIALGPRLARGTGRPPEERLRRDADRW